MTLFLSNEKSLYLRDIAIFIIGKINDSREKAEVKKTPGSCLVCRPADNPHDMIKTWSQKVVNSYKEGDKLRNYKSRVDITD